MEKVTNGLRGMYRDIIKDPENNIYIDSGWKSNTIVDRCRMLLAGFMRSDSSSGIQFLAVGQGDTVWDGGTVPVTNPATTTNLINPHMPPIAAADLDFTYLDDLDNPVSGPTARLQISATLAPDYPPPLPGLTTYPLREFGLFGEFDGSSYMINSIRHPVIHKGATASLIRVVRLYF
ncbi:MAG: hypothetical protein CSB13_01845 [Chloroflexi bacterium]|nr:MAG: hypothetical protein CSB13_01845 [Chloroflexota bacterium]